MAIKDLMREELKEYNIYVAGGRPMGQGAPKHRLMANENQLGPSPKAIEAIAEEAKQGNLYPMIPTMRAKKAISEYVHKPLEDIITYAGSGSGINAIGEAFLNPGDEVLICSPTYMAYGHLPARHGAKLVEVFSKDGVSTDLELLAGAITDKTKLIFICNPNNPTGTILDPARLDEFVEKLPEHVICVVDEAYIDWVDIPNYPSALKYVEEGGKNIIVLRTFSKIYGMAGIRVGYSVANSEITQALNSIAGSFGTSGPAAAGAAAALGDSEFYEISYKNNKEQRDYMIEEMSKMGVDVIPSQTSFIYFAPHCNTQECMDAIEEGGVMIRYFGEQYLRVSIGRPEQNQMFLDALAQYLKSVA